MIRGHLQWIINPIPEAKKLRYGLANRAMRIGTSKGGGVVKNTVIGQAPSRTGALKKAQRVRVKHYKDKSIWAAIVGPSSKYTKILRKGGVRKVIRPSRYAHLVQRGTKYIRANPYLTRSLHLTMYVYGRIVRQKVSEVIRSTLKKA